MANKTITITHIIFGNAEFEVLQQVVQGKARKEIGAALGKPIGTIHAHLRHIFTKVGVFKVNELISWCRDNGFDSKGNYTERKD